jgi:hypothetical protein
VTEKKSKKAKKRKPRKESEEKKPKTHPHKPRAGTLRVDAMYFSGAVYVCGSIVREEEAEVVRATRRTEVKDPTCKTGTWGAQIHSRANVRATRCGENRN